MDPRSSPTIAFAQLHGQWYRTNGAEGLEPPPEIAHIVEIIDEAKTVSRGQQIQLAQELFQLWADNVWEMGTVGLTPMVQGVVVVNDNLYNVPTSAGNDAAAHSNTRLNSSSLQLQFLPSRQDSILALPDDFRAPFDTPG
jgi:hypothetical protein